MGSALYQNLFRGKKKETDTRINWNDNPIPEEDKVNHPEYKNVMKAMDGYENFKATNIGVLGRMTKAEKSTQRDNYFKKFIQNKTITYKGQKYSSQALVPD